MGSGELGSRKRLRVVRVARSLVGRSWRGDALGGSGCWCLGSWGVVFGDVVLGRPLPMLGDLKSPQTMSAGGGVVRLGA